MEPGLCDVQPIAGTEVVGFMVVEDGGSASAREVRDSVFLHATITGQGGNETITFRIRNISSGGLMAEGPMTFSAGDEIDVELRNIGIVHGRVAWAAPGRFGMMFDHQIDPKLARKPVSGGAAPVAPTPDRPIVPPFSRS
jgi:hypothetical protein